MTITFRENKDFSFHNDLHIFIPALGIDGYGDTYYFADDNGILPDEFSEEKVKIVLRNLLTDWENAVEKLQEGDITFLPFDISDQSIAALKLQKKGNQLIIRDAWTPAVSGMSPSFMNKINFKDEQFNVYIGSMTIPIEQFLAEIRMERDKIH
ncbi:hypothetical protein [Spirosoma areae]